jgi:hypothetical protein
MNADNDSLAQIGERLNKLERQNRRLRLMVVCLLVLGGVGVLTGADEGKRRPLDTETLVLRDADGKARARLEVGKQGAVLRFLDDQGGELANLGTTRRGSLQLRLLNRDGGLQTGVGLQRDGVALVYYDQDGNVQSGRNALLLGIGEFPTE